MFFHNQNTETHYKWAHLQAGNVFYCVLCTRHYCVDTCIIQATVCPCPLRHYSVWVPVENKQRVSVYNNNRSRLLAGKQGNIPPHTHTKPRLLCINPPSPHFVSSSFVHPLSFLTPTQSYSCSLPLICHTLSPSCFQHFCSVSFSSLPLLMKGVRSQGWYSSPLSNAGQKEWPIPLFFPSISRQFRFLSSHPRTRHYVTLMC